MRVRFTKGQTYYNEMLVVNRGDFQMARVMLTPETGLHDAIAFDWTKGPPWKEETLTSQVSIKEARKVIKAYLEALPEPPAY